ncbi:MAG: hypothetical protein K0S38_649, partial [Candidatus Paceibacter sp.]|nr:hypothetical protein [Candidatus Paceibacter sp.]
VVPGHTQSYTDAQNGVQELENGQQRLLPLS